MKLHSQFEPGRTLLAWWKNLDDNRAARAELRRASDITEVTLSSHYQKLYRSLCSAGWVDTGHPNRRDGLAAAVGLLAHVELDDDKDLAFRMSETAVGSDRLRVSELRFQRLLESPDIESIFTGLRRVLPLMGKQANVIALTNDIVGWDHDVRKRWAYAYRWPAEKRKT